MGTSTFLQYLQRAAGRWEAQGKQIWNTSRSFAPNVIPDGYITGSINKLQRIGTRYSAGVLAESAIFTIYIEYMSNNVWQLTEAFLCEQDAN